ncbi:MAG: transketolase [Acidimicrobiales bacterium]|nr:transketolase [Acidimicrobiales bacterium]HJL91184.1 transketolase [Acidimicrobiales bacterium]
MPFSEIDHRSIAVIKALAMDAPHAAKSGHQGTAMALAPLSHILWTRIMTYDAKEPLWPNRDRFILSAGHASILLYSMLHLTGYELSLEDLKQFRQLGSRTPGHPERGHTAGVEVTTGPLGQGFANGVGMAIAERNLRARLGNEICDHNIWVVCGDGDLSEGISHEAASLAGHLQLNRLTVIYDDNQITIDGKTDLALSDDASLRFRSYGWNVIELGDESNNLDSIESALLEAKNEEQKPSIIILKTLIGEPSPHTNTAAVHGYSLKDDEIKETKRILEIPENETFWIPDDVLDYYRTAGSRSEEIRKNWEELSSTFGERSELWATLSGSGLTPDWQESLPTWELGEDVATRKASNECIQSLMEFMPGLIGGGADLTGNTGTSISNYGIQSHEEPEGRQIFFGVREHAMGAISNGIALHGVLFPVTGTFLVFSDYMRGAVRLAALSNAKGVFVWSHDSVAVGEDGPTHQPIEHAASLRAIPNLDVFRPADANETSSAWEIAVTHSGPSAMLLTRQDTPVITDAKNTDSVSKGAYIIRESTTENALTIIATGSEVAVACKAAEEIEQELSFGVCVVSMPCMERFERQTVEYQQSIISPTVPSISIEAGSTFGWNKWAEMTIGIDTFGTSAPGDIALTEFGISTKTLLEAANSLLKNGDKK